MSKKTEPKVKKLMPIAAKASVAYMICSIVQKGLALFTLPLFTRLLTVEQYGQYSIYVSWSAIIAIFTTLNMQSGALPRAMIKFEDERDQYISVIQWICLFLSIAFILIYLPLRNFINPLLELPTFLVVIMTSEILAGASITCWMERRRFEYKYKATIIVTLILTVLSPLLAFGLIFLSDEAGYARIIGYAAVTISIGLIIFIYNTVRGKKIFSKPMWKFALGMSIPLIAYYLSQVIFNQIDRIMISNLVGIDKAGIYSVAYNLALVLNFVIIAINNSYVPWFYGKIKEGKQSENKNVISMLSVIVGVLLLGVIWLAPELIFLMGGAQYSEAVVVVPPVALSLLLLFYSQLFINVEFYYEGKFFLVIASIGSAVVNVVLNLIFIPIFGYYAAGYTTFLSYMLFALCNYFAAKLMLRKMKQRNDFCNLKVLLLILVIFCALGFGAQFLYDYYIARYVIIGIVLLVMLINVKNIKKFVQKALKRI